MKAVSRIIGRAVPLDRRDVDTDQIIPSDWLKRVERSGYGAGLFEAWRSDPAFVLNDPRFAGARILLAGANFGCGSSREHAAWALEDFGFEAIVAPSFADIFRTNCRAIGLVTAELPEADVDQLLRAATVEPSLELTVDVERRLVEASSLGYRASFPLDDATRDRLLRGLDEIGITLTVAEAIGAYEARRPDWLPRVTAGGAAEVSPDLSHK